MSIHHHSTPNTTYSSQPSYETSAPTSSGSSSNFPSSHQQPQQSHTPAQQSLHHRPGHSSHGNINTGGGGGSGGGQDTGEQVAQIAKSGLHNLATGVKAYSQHASNQSSNGTANNHQQQHQQSAAPVKRAGSRAAPFPSSASSSSSSSSSSSHRSITSYITIVTELIFILLEFICGLTLLKYCLYTAIASLSPLHPLNDNLIIQLLVNTLSNIGILTWCLTRFAYRMNTTPGKLLHKLGATDCTVNRLTMIVIGLHTMGFLIMFSIDSASNGSHLKYFSMANYMIPTEAREFGLGDGEALMDSLVSAPATSSSGQWNVVQILDMLIYAPVREEIVFRGIALTYLLSRLANDRSPAGKSATSSSRHNVISKVINTVASVNDDAIKSQQITAAFYNGLAFGLIHILNLFTAKTNYSATYCALQIILGTTVGWFYSLHIILYDSLFQVMAMHIANNLYSSFLPLDLAITMDDPILVCSLASTVIIYISLTVIAVQAIRDRPYTQLTVLKQKLV